MKKFDIEEAKKGVGIITKNEKKVNILSWDKKGPYPIVAIIEEKPGLETVFEYTKEGINSRILKRDYNLFLDIEEPEEVNIDKEEKREFLIYRTKLTLFYIFIILSLVFVCLGIFTDELKEDRSLLYICLSVISGAVSLILRRRL